MTPALNRLERDGVSRKLEPRAMDLLVYLANAGDVVPTSELLEKVWQGRVFDDGIVYNKINQLRKALGDDAQGSQYIETIPRRGYRLVAPVVVLGVEDDAGLGASDERREPGSPQAATGSERDGDEPPQAADHSSNRRSVAYLAAAALALVLAIHGSSLRNVALDDAGDSVQAASAEEAEGREPDPLSPRVMPLTFDGGFKSRPRLSPDGTMVAFTWSGNPPANDDIYVRQIGADTAPIRITDHPSFDGAPTWSPDGKQLAFLRDETPPPGGRLTSRFSIYVVPSLGGQARKITELESIPVYGPFWLGVAAWSPNGRLLAYSDRPSADAPARIVELDMETGRKRALSAPPAVTNIYGDLEPVYSPDGKRIAFMRGSTSFSALDVWVMDAQGGNEQQITTDRWPSALALSWTAHGDELLFAAGTTSLRSYSVRLGEGIPRPLPGLGENEIVGNSAADRLVFVKEDRDVLQMWQAPGRLAQDRGAPSRDLDREGIKLVFSPNGEKIAWQSHRTGRPQVWIANADGSDPYRLTDQTVDAFNPHWSPDGQKIAFHSHDAANADLYLVDVASRRVQQLTTDESEERYPTFSRDGKSLYFSSNRSGRFEIYRMAVAGGPAIPVTQSGGTYAIESPDGEYLYYEYLEDHTGHWGDRPLWRIPVDGSGPPIEALPGWERGENCWVLSRTGIYYVLLSGTSSIRYRDVNTGTDIEILPRSGGWDVYPAVSPNEETIFFSRDAFRGSELWLVEPFPP